LINELKNINRVIQPTLKLYIGESIAGNGIISQVGEFNEAVGISGVILTKLDCDAKGGTALSITKASGIPIVYLGIGQKYEDLEKFDAEKMIDRILG
jgi:fused signal recognition particle receptor